MIVLQNVMHQGPANNYSITLDCALWAGRVFAVDWEAKKVSGRFGETGAIPAHDMEFNIARTGWSGKTGILFGSSGKRVPGRVAHEAVFLTR